MRSNLPEDVSQEIARVGDVLDDIPEGRNINRMVRETRVEFVRDERPETAASSGRHGTSWR